MPPLYYGTRPQHSSCYRLTSTPAHDTERLPLPVGEGWGEGPIQVTWLCSVTGWPAYARPNPLHLLTTDPRHLYGRWQNSRYAASPFGNSAQSVTGKPLRCWRQRCKPGLQRCSVQQSLTATGCGGTPPAANARTVRALHPHWPTALAPAHRQS
ncbi:hypothetical protein D3C76_1449460 [compost metagenome]